MEGRVKVLKGRDKVVYWIKRVLLCRGPTGRAGFFWDGMKGKDRGYGVHYPHEE